VKRPILLAGLGLAFLIGGCVGAVYWVTGEAPPPPRSEAAPAAVVETRPADTLPPPPPVASAPIPRKPPVAPAPARRATWSASVADPSAVPMADRVTRKAVRKALLAPTVQSRLSRCVDRDIGFGGGPKPGRIPRALPAVLLLELETRDGEAQIVDARVRGWGGASREVVTCASDVVLGQVARAAGIAGGRQMRMPFPLHPKSTVVAASR
jgi:hypothetical protein